MQISRPGPMALCGTARWCAGLRLWHALGLAHYCEVLAQHASRTTAEKVQRHLCKHLQADRTGAEQGCNRGGVWPCFAGAQVRPSFTLEQAAFPPFPVSDELRTLCAQQGLSPDITAFPGAAPTVVRAEIPPGDAFTPREWGQAAAALVDEHLPATGALLFK